jgi:hypothetical protein
MINNKTTEILGILKIIKNIEIDSIIPRIPIFSIIPSI